VNEKRSELFWDWSRVNAEVNFPGTELLWNRTQCKRGLSSSIVPQPLGRGELSFSRSFEFLRSLIELS